MKCTSVKTIILLCLSAFAAPNMLAQKAYLMDQKLYVPEIVVQTGHTREITSIAFSPDSRLIATGSEDTQIKLWDASTGKVVRTLKAGASQIASVDFCDNGRNLVSLEWGGRPVSWNIYSGKRFLRYGMDNESANAAICTDRAVILGGDDGVIEVRDLVDNKMLFEFPTGKSDIYKLAVSPDQKQLAVGYKDGAISIWDINAHGTYLAPNWTVTDGRTGRMINQKSNVHSYPINSLWFGKDRIISSGGDFKVREWDLSVDKTDVFQVHSAQDTSNRADLFCMSRDGKLFAQSKFSGGIIVKESESKDVQWDFNPKVDYRTVQSVSPNGQFVAYKKENEPLKIWIPVTGTVTVVSEEKIDNVNSIAFSSDSQKMVFGGDNGIFVASTVKPFDLVRLDSPTGKTFKVEKMGVSRSGNLIAISDRKNGYVVINRKTSRIFRSEPPPAGRNDVVEFAFSEDESLLGVGYSEGATRIFDTTKWREKIRYSPLSAHVSSLAFSANNAYFAVGYNDGTVFVLGAPYSVTTRYQSLKGSHPVETVVFSADSKKLGVSLEDSSFFSQDISFDNPTPPVQMDANSREGRGIISKSFPTFFQPFSFLGNAVGFIDHHQGKIRYFNKSFELICSLVVVGSDEWIVFTPSGIFEASSQESERLIHYVIADWNLTFHGDKGITVTNGVYSVDKVRTGFEVIELEQVWKDYHEEGLFRKIMSGQMFKGQDKFSVTLYPTIENARSKKRNSIRLILANRGGGIGRIRAKLNGVTFFNEIEPVPDPNEKTAEVTINIPDTKLPEDGDVLEITTRNEADYLESQKYCYELKGVGWTRSDGKCNRFISFVGRGDNNIKENEKNDKTARRRRRLEASDYHFYAIISGISDYYEKDIDLNFAAKDAEDMAKAMALTARRWFCNKQVQEDATFKCENVHIRLLTKSRNKAGRVKGLDGLVDFKRVEFESDGGTSAKQKYRDVFGEISKVISRNDVFLGYFSGHGTSVESTIADKKLGYKDLYLYPTPDASRLDPDYLKHEEEDGYNRFITGVDFLNWTSVMKSQHKIAIFDTCASGVIGRDLSESKDGVSEVVVRDSIRGLVDNSGLYILSSSTEDRRSYESNYYGQGLLTRALLFGLSQKEILEKDHFLDVDNWFSFAKLETTRLAKKFDRSQIPTPFKTRYSRSFDIGWVDDGIRDCIQVSEPVPLILKPSLRFDVTEGDQKKLGAELVNRLHGASLSRGRGPETINFVSYTQNSPGGYSPRGRYTYDDRTKNYEVTISLYSGENEQSSTRMVFSGDRRTVLDQMVKGISRKAKELHEEDEPARRARKKCEIGNLVEN